MSENVWKMDEAVAQDLIDTIARTNEKTGEDVQLLCAACQEPIQATPVYSLMDVDGKFNAVHRKCVGESHE